MKIIKEFRRFRPYGYKNIFQRQHKNSVLVDLIDFVLWKNWIKKDTRERNERLLKIENILLIKAKEMGFKTHCDIPHKDFMEWIASEDYYKKMAVFEL